MIFQQILSDNNSSVQKLSRTARASDVAKSFIDAWTFILTDINYEPIFTVARNILLDLEGSPGTDEALKRLAQTAENITKRRAALRHDLMGRIYHRLLADAKYFGAYYTTVPAAALLLKLTLDPDTSTVDWGDLEQIKALRVADLACGTGTLLKATLQTVVDNYVRACAANGTTPDLPALHKVMVEQCLWGLDVVEFAIHLAASALAVHEPDVQFHDMKLWTLPLGRRSHSYKLGSIELFTSHQATVQADLFGSVSGPERVTGKGASLEKVRIPSLDLCVMNPPFTRSVGGNLLFGNLPIAQRTRMQSQLKRLVKKDSIPANVTAGLGTVFTALGSRYVKSGGRLSLVLPRALLSGVAWEKTRTLIGYFYQVEYIITSHEPGAWNFSENTKLGECLVIARRFNYDEGVKNTNPTKFVNLWEKPQSSVDAVTYAHHIKTAPGVELESDTGTSALMMGSHKVGEVLLCPRSRISSGDWRFEAAFSRTDLCRTAFFLSMGTIYLPTRGSVGKVPIRSLGKLGLLGPDARDIHDGFEVVSGKTAYDAFWGHDTDFVQTMAQKRNKYLSPRAKPIAKRNLRDPHLLWSRSGRVLIPERLRLNTARLFAIRLAEPVLTNSWWTLRTFESSEVSEADAERVITFWLNSTLGIISLLASRVDTEGAWMKFKKPIWKDVGLLDPFSLRPAQVEKIVRAYEDVKNERLSRLPEMSGDEVRAKIDATLMDALEIDEDLSKLRNMLAEEPLIKAPPDSGLSSEEET
jgi:hypothetical protein